jgi:putative tryptophan/tyrosine transport system substrate-binding protein
MKRRQFITLLGGAAAAWPLAARAQQPAMPVIGYVSARSSSDSVGVLSNFNRGLAETGYIEGRNVAIEYRWAEGRYETVPTMIADLVSRRVAVIVIPNGTASVLAAKAATQTIPIIFSIGSNPVEIGLVASFNHPGGNLTGVVGLYAELAGKRLELLHELTPSTTLIGFLVNPNNPVYAAAETRQVESQARASGVRLLTLNASSPSEIEAAFATLVQQQAGALLVGGDVYFVTRSDQIIALAARHKLSAIFAYIEETAAGGLVGYGERLAVAQHMVGVYAGRILKGEKPADLPVQQVTRVELAINMKTAKALGLTLPLALLTRADEVIE